MYRYTYWLILTFSLVVASCKDYLDLPPLNIINDDQVFADEKGLDSYMATLYRQLPVEDFNFAANSAAGANVFPSGYFPPLFTEEMQSVYFVRSNLVIDNGTYFSWWGYNQIRNANYFIQKIPSANAIAEKRRNELLAEAKFLRAYDYFALAKRYGGVPIITVPQVFTGSNLEELQVPRNKEQEVWDFILKELDEAIALLPENYPGINGNRANKYAALALKSRAALYAASIAKYGTVNLDGLVGIPASEANRYWQQSYDASKVIIDSKRYALYRKDADKAKNFAAYFAEKGDESETIFKKVYKYPEQCHSFDNWALPAGYVGLSGYGSGYAPTLEMAEAFEYTDGSDGKLKITDEQGNPVEYTNPLDLIKDKDPRCAGTIIFPSADWLGNIIDVRAGIIHNGQTITSGTFDQTYSEGGKTMKIVGRSGIVTSAENTVTGMYLRKHLDYSQQHLQAVGTSDQPWKEFRYAEILLNYAEAAVEMGKTDDARDALNDIRDRAGIRLLTSGEVTLDKVRHERFVELAFENHRNWDLKRWRIYDKVINNLQSTALYPYYVWEHDKYIFKAVKIGQLKKFFTQAYYQKIDAGEIAKNPRLVQNPGF